MLIACQAWEGMYQGLHGIEDIAVFEVKDLKEASQTLYDWGMEASEELIYFYGLEEQYCEENDDDEEYDITDSVYYCDRGWRGFIVKEGSFKSEKEADKELCELGWNLFIKQYGEKEID